MTDVDNTPRTTAVVASLNRDCATLTVSQSTALIIERLANHGAMLEGELAEAQKWTSVSEALPDADSVVLAAIEDSAEPVWLAVFDAAGDGQWCDDQGAAIHVTHWRPIPDGPKETK